MKKVLFEIMGFIVTTGIAVFAVYFIAKLTL